MIVISPRNRALAWVLLILLTVVLLLFPVHLANEYHPIQAPYLFDNLPLFGTLCCIWILLILFLLFSKKDRGNILDWEDLALSCVFGLFFLGFWVIITPYGSFSDGIFNMGHVRWLLDDGSIPIGHQNLWYFDFPGMHLLLAAISQVTNLGVFESRMLFLIVNAVLFSALLYILFAKLLKSSRLASLGVLLVIMTSVYLIEKMHIFTPGALGYTLMAGFLVMLTGSETRLFGTTVSDRLLMLILFIAMTISYFATSFLAPLILLGIYAVQRLGRDRQARARLRTIILLLFMVIAWEIYWTWHTFNGLAVFLPEAQEGLFAGEFLTDPLTLVKANIGGELPLWATITRSFWWALIGFSIILGFRNLFKVKELSFAEKIVTGGFVGIILLTIVGIFGTSGGQQFGRFLMYGPLFCVPILLMFLQKSGTWGKRGFTLLTALLIILALPTFLSSVNTVATDAIYPYEVSAGQFMESHSRQKGADYIVHGLNHMSIAWADYYVPDTSSRRYWNLDIAYLSGSEDKVWQELDKSITRFQNPYELPGKQKIFVISQKSTVSAQHLVGISPDHPKWGELWALLASTNRIFNNGQLQIYAIH